MLMVTGCNSRSGARASTRHFRLGLIGSRPTLGRIMRPNNQVSRREFIASTSVLLAASQLGVAETTDNEADKLALDGGKKAVSRSMPKPKRWGEPELQQLGAAVKQDSLYYWNNAQTKLLMERFRAVYGHKYVQPCSSGSASLHIAVAAAGIAPGDEVITSGITDIGTVIGVLFQQAVPVFADLEPQTGCLDPADVERKITPKTKAIIAVHLAGNPCKLAELKEIADKHKLILIEDCAQAWGALYRGKPISSVGQIGCFSLQDSKHIACGDGGVATSGDEKFGPLLIKFGDKGTNRLNPKDSSHGAGRQLPHERAAGGVCGGATDAAGRHRRAALEAGQPADAGAGRHPRHHDAPGAPG